MKNQPETLVGLLNAIQHESRPSVDMPDSGRIHIWAGDALSLACGKWTVTRLNLARKIIGACEDVDARAVAADGPVTPFHQEATAKEIDALARWAYLLAKEVIKEESENY